MWKRQIYYYSDHLHLKASSAHATKISVGSDDQSSCSLIILSIRIRASYTGGDSQRNLHILMSGENGCARGAMLSHQLTALIALKFDTDFETPLMM